jgi:hypothetical protein
MSSAGMKGDGLIDDLAKALQPTSADLAWAGNVIKAGIIKRTAAGLDWQGNPFAPYSAKGPYYWYPGGGVRGVRRMAKRVGGEITRSGTGIRFESYAAFKKSLGRAGGVDLMGPRAPHMMQAIVVQVRGGVAYVGIYDEFAAAKAEGHNNGTSRLPKREFFQASDDDIAAVTRDLADRLVARGRQIFR